ncbi:hypothetical protein [Streptomyces goshikiensis]|uniref:hypothetical protein n=1 Tax=Streptomyces goshikiensis TaxID=1942 RepID=UPI003664BF54
MPTWSHAAGRHLAHSRFCELRCSHDYIRVGTTTTLSLHRRHGAAEFKKFLAAVDREVPADLQVHLILDKVAAYCHRISDSGH